MQIVTSSYNRLGSLLAAGFVKEADLFKFIGLTRGAIMVWEKTKHLVRATEESGIMPSGMYQEYLAARAQSFLDRKGLESFGNIPRFDADPAILDRVAREISEARLAA